MSIEGSLSDYFLLDVITMLSKRKDSGRLQVDLGANQAFFYFEKGELQAARIGTLTGFSAVNLALTLDGTRFRFEPGVDLPGNELSGPNEKLLLNKLLEIPDSEVDPSIEECNLPPITTLVPFELAKVPDPAEEQYAASDSDLTADLALSPQVNSDLAAVPEVPTLLEAQGENGGELSSEVDADATCLAQLSPETSELTKAPDTLESETAEMDLESPFSLPRFMRRATKVSHPAITNLYNRYNRFPKQFFAALRMHADLDPNRASVTLKAATILLIGLPAAIGITTLWIKGKEAPAVKSSAQPTSDAPLPTPALTVPTPSESKLVAVRTEPILAAPIQVEPTSKLPPERAQPVKSPAEILSSKINLPVTAVELPTGSEKPQKREESPSEAARPVQPTTQSIAVVVRVDNGLVVEAYIKEHRSNLAAYEATALQLARQRRYPKNTDLTETISVQITREQ